MAAASNSLILGIDGSNLREGGGLIHIVELLAFARPEEHGFEQVIIWGGNGVLRQIEDRRWLVKRHQPQLDQRLYTRLLWQRIELSRLAEEAGCNLLFVPGGSYIGNFRPLITMSRNMLPFEWRELRRYGFSSKSLRLLALRFTQSNSFKVADGLIFLMSYARDVIMHKIGTTSARVATIPHGVKKQFIAEPRIQKPIDHYSWEHPFRVLYVSTVDLYKHQWHVVNAIAQLRLMGLPLTLDLIGPAYPQALKRLNALLERVDPEREFVRYRGAIPHTELPQWHLDADIAVFASSCENMPNTLLEAMASGMPIVCSSSGPMPQVLKDGGSYCDPEKALDIARAIRRLVNSPELRTAKARLAFDYAMQYSWQRCADETFAFLEDVARGAARRVAA